MKDVLGLLANRHSSTETSLHLMCDRCGREETVEHAILTCQYASEVCCDMKRCFGLRLNIKYLVSIKQW
jgi:hypothetical protein